MICAFPIHQTKSPNRSVRALILRRPLVLW